MDKRKISIIIAEDDPVSAHLVRINAESLGFEISGMCEDAVSTLKTAHECFCPVAIIDISLNGSMDGIQLARQMQIMHHTAIIFISSYDNEDTFNEALPLLPVAYLVKPVKNSDIKAALLLAEQWTTQRAGSSFENPEWIDLPYSCRYHKTSQRLLHKTVSVELTPLEKKLLALLIDHHGSCVSCEQITETLWNDSDATIDSLRSLVRRFHQKLGLNLITNIYAKGYKIDLIPSSSPVRL